MINLAIIFIPDNKIINGKLSDQYPADKYGAAISTLSKVNFNKISDGYTLLIPYSMISNCKITVLYTVIKNWLLKVMGEGTARIIYQMIPANGAMYEKKFLIYARSLVQATSKIDENRIQVLVGKNVREFSITSDDDEDDDEYGFNNQEMEEEIETRSTSTADELWARNNNMVNVSFDVKGKKRKKSSKKKDKDKDDDIDIKKSAIFKHADHPKKDIEKYGLVIISDKDDIKKDYKTLLKVANEFIPGKEKWKKQFRQNVAARWLMSYCISKKKLKKVKANIEVNKKPDTVKTLSKSLYAASSIWTNPQR